MAQGPLPKIHCEKKKKLCRDFLVLESKKKCEGALRLWGWKWLRGFRGRFAGVGNLLSKPRPWRQNAPLTSRSHPRSFRHDTKPRLLPHKTARLDNDAFAETRRRDVPARRRREKKKPERFRHSRGSSMKPPNAFRPIAPTIIKKILA
ncbi:uncharacterized protein TM35_000351600 [Trypanosoma theileri]|uniref:Uncharacterized protein n=1 Tax=Trypanosoma theileri TaxID=67003 RepID=A0A1X0NL40_9TRYP|nr:uncharacterized protein TM35_000351600 [Trypanosoma theileri]ORC85416.1 hypothetical protein TM35_000351600 [Trypanosoma theileri]